MLARHRRRRARIEQTLGFRVCCEFASAGPGQMVAIIVVHKYAVLLAVQRGMQCC